MIWMLPRMLPRAALGAQRCTHDGRRLAQRTLADVGNDTWSLAPADLVDLHERLDGEWRSWRQALGALNESSAAGR
jgi:hypothetical protein